MTLHSEIRQFLRDATSTTNLASSREKLAVAMNLLERTLEALPAEPVAADTGHKPEDRL